MDLQLTQERGPKWIFCSTLYASEVQNGPSTQLIPQYTEPLESPKTSRKLPEASISFQVQQTMPLVFNSCAR
eukprot:3765863-Ditylum_brightwellii.AAC.1